MTSLAFANFYFDYNNYKFELELRKGLGLALRLRLKLELGFRVRFFRFYYIVSAPTKRAPSLLQKLNREEHHTSIKQSLLNKYCRTFKHDTLKHVFTQNRPIVAILKWNILIWYLHPTTTKFYSVCCFAALKIHFATQKFRAMKHIQGISNLEPPLQHKLKHKKKQNCRDLEQAFIQVFQEINNIL